MTVVEQRTDAVDQLFVDAALVELVDSVDRYSRKPSGNEDLLNHTVDQWAIHPEDVAVELSGGMDSAMVALCLGARYRGQLASYGLLVDGPAGIQHCSRRTVLVKHAGLCDTTFSALMRSPFDPRGVRGQGQVWNPSEEPYSEALHAVIMVTGRQVVFTGIGGDELLALRPEGARRR